MASFVILAALAFNTVFWVMIVLGCLIEDKQKSTASHAVIATFGGMLSLVALGLHLSR